MREQTEYENWLTGAQRDDLREGDGIVGGTAWIGETAWWNCGRGSTPGFGRIVVVFIRGYGSTLGFGWLIVCNRGQREGEDEGEF